MAYFSKEEMIARRENLFAQMEDYSVCILFSGVSKISSADACYPFVVNKNFYYMTQIEQENSMLVLIKTPASQDSFLFISPFDEVKEKWTGKLLTVNEAKEISYIDNVLINDAFEPKLHLLIRDLLSNDGGRLIVYLDLDDEIKIKPATSTKDFKYSLIDRYDGLSIFNIYDSIINLRMVKSDEEVERIKTAILITKSGLLNVINNLNPGENEYLLAAAFEYEIKAKYNSKISFDTIAASGKNATILHYPNPIDTLKSGDLMLFDLGAQYQNYCADISRTYPVSGTYNEMQAALYNAVLKTNELVINSIRPGVTIQELQEITKRSLAASLIELGIMENPEDLFKYYYHNVSHHLGLDTHDPSFRDRPLEPGNVITVEPGLYIKELGLGIRIEDDVLVTKTGSLNLSSGITKSIADIEKMILSRGIE